MLSNWIGGGGKAYFNSVWKAVIDADAQSNFRRNPDYNSILEHVTKDQGDQYLKSLTSSALLDICRRSEDADKIGSPLTFDFAGMIISPTTLRYAKVAQDILEFFPNFAAFTRIAEIGVGYGGQARVLDELSRTLDGALSTYTLVDMLPVALLSQSYLENFSLYARHSCITKSQIDRTESWDLCISNFAYAEFDRGLQEEYFAHILSKSTSGYITMNTGIPGRTVWNDSALNIYDMLGRLPNAVIARELPNTMPTNYIVVYGQHSLGAGVSVEEFLSSI